MDCVPSRIKLPFGRTSTTVTVTLPATRLEADVDPFALNLSEPLAEAACRKSKMPMPVPRLTDPLFSFAELRVAEVVVVSLMTMVTISPMPVAR
jgi:hypothetical protein